MNPVDMMHGWPVRPMSRLPMQSPVPDTELVATYESEQQADVPCYVDPFLGYRAWTVCQRDDGMLWLRSVTYQIFWPMQEELHASCRAQRCEGSPNNSSCACGIYVVRELDAAKTWAHQSTANFRVLGRVKIWGRIFQYEKGFIVEYAYPETIWVPDDYSFWEGNEATSDLRGLSPNEISLMLEAAYKINVGVGWPESD